MVYKLLSCLYNQYYIPQRWLGVFLIQSVISVCYCMRVCTSVAIGRMVIQRKDKNISDTSQGSGCPLIRARTNDETQYGENDWNESIQSWILNSFFVTYVLSHIPMGYMADKYGARWILNAGVLLCIVCTALIPISADKIGYIAVIVLRSLQGIGQAGLFPALMSWSSCWIPKHERTFLCSLACLGTFIGPLLGILVTNVLLKLNNDWRVIFYFWATISFLIFFAMLLYVYSGPNSHMHITQREKEYLNHILVAQGPKCFPYRSIISDFAVIAIIIGHIGHNFVIFLIANIMPKYMNQVLKYHIEDNAIITSLPYVSMFLSTLLSAKLANWGISKKGWDVGFVRKVYTTIASVFSSGLLVGVGYIGCNNILALTFFTVSLCFKGWFYPGVKINVLDISTQYAGLIMGLANGFANTIGYFGPYLVSYIATDNTLSNWQTVFWVMLAISATTNLFYVIYGSGHRCRWDYAEEDKQFFEGKVRKCKLFDGEDLDRLAVERGRSTLPIIKKDSNE